MLRKLPALATAALIAAGLVAGPTAAGAANAATTIPVRSGLGWASGVFIPGDSAGAHESFGNWRGAKTDVVVTWPARSNWNDVVNSTWLYDRWKNAPQTLVLGLPPFPENVGANLDACANGAYDAQWRQFGSTIKNYGITDRTIIRLGWEFNGNWYAWSARNPATFAACWRKVHAAAESTAPGLRWDWNVNRGTSQLGIDARNAYPGDAYVDIVGVDSYDGWPGATNEATWNEHYNGAFGLKFWNDFAKAHGKQLSVPEWGVYPGTAWAGHNGGDNPFYIAKMFGFFKEVKDNLAYEAYFNEPASYYAGALSMNPRAAAEYQKQTGLAVTAAAAAPAPSTPAPTATATPSTAPTTAPATPTVTVTAPAVTATRTVTATVTAPAAPAVTVTVTAPAAPAVTVTAPAAPAVTVTAPAAPPVTVTLPAVTVTEAPTAAPTAAAPTVTKAPTKKPAVTKKPIKKPTTKPAPKKKAKKAKKKAPRARLVTAWTIVETVQQARH